MLAHGRVLAARAVERELAGDYDAAFEDYTDAVQLLLDGVPAQSAHSSDRAMAARLLTRAELVAGKRTPRSRFASWDDTPPDTASPPKMSAAQVRMGGAYSGVHRPIYAAARPGEVCQGEASDCTLIAAIEAAAAHDAQWNTNVRYC